MTHRERREEARARYTLCRVPGEAWIVCDTAYPVTSPMRVCGRRYQDLNTAEIVLEAMRETVTA